MPAVRAVARRASRAGAASRRDPAVPDAPGVAGRGRVVLDENPFDGHELEDALLVDAPMGWDGATRATSGQPLGAADPEEPATDGVD